jgi:hypothetical protein
MCLACSTVSISQKEIGACADRTADPTVDQTEEDRETIRKLIKSYLNDKRTIILLVAILETRIGALTIC